ncbi:MAG: radical SAM protein [Elusimicrobiales bacterium]|jgi:MoaA/NifB/PqqE/SkfB family radical SAM enzyme
MVACIRTVADKLEKAGLRVLINAEDNIVELSLRRTADPLKARRVLYGALNGLEPFFTVYLKGVPFCFMPDAWDHALYRARAGAVYARVAACAACRLNAFCPGLEKNGVFYTDLRGELSPVLAAPDELVIELTKKCNLNCRVCSSARRGEELSFRELCGVLRQAKKTGVRNIRFTGGEPFLSKELLPALKEAKELGFYTLVNTNAAAGGQRLLKQAASLIDNLLVSMQGRDERTESEATRTPGLFHKKLDNIRSLKAGGIKVLRLGTVISSDLLENFSAYYKLAGRIKARIWELYRPMTAGGAAGKEGFRPGPEDLKRLSRSLASLKAASPRVLIANPVPLCLVPAAERKNFLGAAFDDGHTRLVYDPRGFFKPSYYIDTELGASLKKAWGSRFLKTLGGFDYLPGRCGTCRDLLKCLGGSRAQAAASGAGCFAPDPWMPRQKPPADRA